MSFRSGPFQTRTQDKDGEAEALLISGYEGMKSREQFMPAFRKNELPTAVDRPVRFYEVVGKSDAATRWRTERAKYPFVAPPPREKK